MKHIKSLFLGLTAACTVFAVGCGGGDSQADHDHEHGDDHSHDEMTNAPAANGTNAPMGAVGDVSAAKPYPLDVCIVSGEELGSMGDPIVMVHEGQTVKFCCDSCVPDFEKDPAKFITKLTAAPVQ